MKKFFKNQKGSGIALFSVSFMAVIGMAAFAVDVGVLMTARNQLQTGAEASVLASATGLHISQNEAIARGIDISHHNAFMDTTLNLEEKDFSFPNVDMVQVVHTRKINTFFSQFFGVISIPVAISATAKLGNRDIMFIFDRSGSMDDDIDVKNKDKKKKDKKDNEKLVLYPQPITDTKESAFYLVDLIRDNQISEDELGLISYSGDATVDEEIGRNFEDVKRTIAGLEADGATNIGDAIKLANDRLMARSRRHTKKIIILFSDGKPNRPKNENYAKAYAKGQAHHSADNNIKIHTISLGQDTDRRVMDYIASTTGGHHYSSPTTNTLDQIFRSIESIVPALLITKEEAMQAQ